MNTLILSGWTQPVDALAVVAGDALTFDYSDYPSPEASFAGLAALPDVSRIIAWSMGGQLALRAIAAGVLAPRHLTLIAAPWQFVSSGPELAGMDPTTFHLFRESYASDPARTSARFHALVAKGDSDAKRVMGALRHHPQVLQTARWLPWLDDLAATTLADTALARVPPTLILHGMNDQIVPHAQGVCLAQRLPDAELLSWAGVGHAPRLHDPARVVAEIAAHQVKHGVGV